MNPQPFNVLFLCTGNSARSIMAEVLMNVRGNGKFRGYSAGSHPKGEVHPCVYELLTRLNFSTEGLRSKSWGEFSHPSAPKMDFVFTVCDRAGAESCPIWPGQPITAHWGIPDPAASDGDSTQKIQAFGQAFRELENRIKQFVSLPISTLDSLRLQEKLQEIGRTTGELDPSTQAPSSR